MVVKCKIKLSDICTMPVFKKASHNAGLGKSDHKAVKIFNSNEDENLKGLIESLLNRTYTTGEYRSNIIYEPKEREIFILDYEHRVVQHALIDELEETFVNMFIKDTYACIKGRGIHQASLRTTEFVQSNEYCLKMDIRKFYPSINHDILYRMLERKFKDKGILWLFKDIIYSFPGETNVPIGNLTSQWFGNFYMSALDRLVKEELKTKCYLRYCDDFLLFSNSKYELNDAKYQIIDFLDSELRLKLSKCDLFKTSRGVDFVGYRHFGHYLLLRKSTAKGIKKKLPKIYQKYKAGIISPDEFRSIVDSYIGWAEWANAYNFIKSTKLLEYRSEIMGKFSEIAEENDKNLRKLEGEKVKIDEWLDKTIKITNFRVEPSNYKDKNGKARNRIGFEFYYEGSPRVIFTSACTLMYLIPKYCKKDDPLETKIIKKPDGQYILG